MKSLAKTSVFVASMLVALALSRSGPIAFAQKDVGREEKQIPIKAITVNFSQENASAVPERLRDASFEAMKNIRGGTNIFLLRADCLDDAIEATRFAFSYASKLDKSIAPPESKAPATPQTDHAHAWPAPRPRNQSPEAWIFGAAAGRFLQNALFRQGVISTLQVGLLRGRCGPP
ncbi:MAG: hypothetical protein K2X38_20020 [Gemmataceae bacterium]|nr:hypothetical protein [Gemmataceae bacterium]